MLKRILVVDDERNLRESLSEALSQSGYAVETAADGEQAYAAMQSHSYDLVLCDWSMLGMGGKQLLSVLQSEGRLVEMPVIVITAHGTSGNAIEAIQLGAYDFITKPFDLEEVLVVIRRALDHAALQHEVRRLRREVSGDKLGADEMIGSSAAMLEVFKAIGRVAQTDSTILITGESGTGKELVARAVHRHSERSRGPFIVVNCAALPENLIESELFGYEKGAFTGALQRKAGKFESAQGGTVFLDEIGELPLAVQPKLLRVLQERTFERLGGVQSTQADFRLIAATNRNLEDEVERGGFRRDLYFRLNVVPVALPPLRERRADIVPLAEYFLDHYSRRHQLQITGFTEDALLRLQRHAFPGNVRELEHIVERAVLAAGGRAIAAELIPEASSPASASGSDLPRLLDLPYHDAVRALEKLLIDRAMERAGGNKAEAARALQMHRRLLYEKLDALQREPIA